MVNALAGHHLAETPLHVANVHPAVVPAPTVRTSADDLVVSAEVAHAPRTSPSPTPNSAPPASPGILFLKTDWPKQSAPTSLSSLWRSLHNATGFRGSFDPATPPRRTVSSAIPKLLKPPAILSASASTPMKAKRRKKLFAATSTVASKTPPSASFRPMAKRNSRGAAGAPIRCLEAIS